MEQHKKYKIGLVLSGGAARGIAHLGVLKALNEKKIRPEIICATSAGSVMGLLYADGHRPEEILKLTQDKKIFDYLDISFRGSGLFTSSKLLKQIRSAMQANTFEELSIPVHIAAVNFHNGQLKTFYKGDIFDPLAASMAFPLLFKPVEIDGHPYVDGGIVSNMPARCIADLCEHIIGVYVNPIKEVEKFSGIQEKVEQVIDIATYSNILIDKPKCSLYIEPENLKYYPLPDIKDADEMFEIGYKSALKAIEDHDGNFNL